MGNLTGLFWVCYGMVVNERLDISRTCLGTKGVAPMNVCELCGKHLANRRAYAGHMLLAHHKRVGFMADFDAVREAVYYLGICLGEEKAEEVARILTKESGLKEEVKLKIKLRE